MGDEKKGVKEKLIEAVMRLYDGVRTKVREGNGLSEAFEVKVELHQESVLSPLLIVIVMDACVRSWRDCYLKFYMQMIWF